MVLTSVIILDRLQLQNLSVRLMEADKLILKPTILQLQCQQLLSDALGFICNMPHHTNAPATAPAAVAAATATFGVQLTGLRFLGIAGTRLFISQTEYGEDDNNDYYTVYYLLLLLPA